MSATEDLDLDYVTDEPEPEPSAGGVWDHLRADHAEIVSEQPTTVMEIPGTKLAVRYRYVDPRDLEKPGRKVAKIKGEADRGIAASCLTLAMCCEEILIYLPDDPASDESGYRPLSEPGEPPVRFDLRLAEGMEMRPEVPGSQIRAADIIRRAFKGNEWAIIRQAEEVAAWMSDPAASADEKFLGE